MRKFLVVTVLLVAFVHLSMGQGIVKNGESYYQGSRVLPNMMVVKLKNRISDVSWFARNLPWMIDVSSFRDNKSSSFRTSSELDNIHFLHFSKSINHESVISIAKEFSDVEYVEPVYIREMSYVPSDPSKGQQWYLNKIDAYNAWDVERDASDVVIAIVDSGVELSHADLSENIYVNSLEIPNNGVDDEGDGYVDNYYGWDFVGSSIDAIIQAGDPVDWADWEDSNPNTSGSDHGTHVAGIASGVFNNGTGIAGLGAGAKLMVLKCGEDGGGSYPTSILRGYDAIVYAAEHGADIINCSWGGGGYSQFEQDVINYATELGSLVIAAAGNGRSSDYQYPGSYNNVLSVGNTTNEDRRNISSTYNDKVDVSAPGTDIYSTIFGSGYGVKTGTSMASPLVAGLAALVKSKRPSLSPLQIAEVIRTTSDDINSVLATNSRYKMGRGRINAYRALTEKSPSIRINDILLKDDDFSLQAGDEISVDLEVINYLESANNIQASLSIIGSYVSISDADEMFGSFESLQAKSFDNVFTFEILENAPDNLELTLLISFSDGESYEDWQAYTVIVNQTYLNLIGSTISTSIASNGRLGYLVTGSNAVGLGFNFNGENLLYEMGLLMGTSESNVSSTIRSSTEQTDDHYGIESKVRLNGSDSERRATFDYVGVLNDSKAPVPLGVNVSYNVMAWNQEGSSDFYIIEYEIVNKSESSISNLHLGLYADWDIGSSGSNSGGYDETRELGYITTSSPSSFFAGMAVISNDFGKYYNAIDNAGYSFSSANKFLSISGGQSSSSVSNVDASHFVGAGPISLSPDQSQKVAFVVLAGSSLIGLQSTYDRADYLYNTTLSLVRPVAMDIDVCFGEDYEVVIDGYPNLRWYDRFEGGTLLYEGTSLVLNDLEDDVTLFVATFNDSNDESVRSPINLKVLPKNDIVYQGDLVLCDGEVISLTAADGDSFLWSTGETTQTIEVTQEGTYFVEVTNAALGCTTTSEEIMITTSTTPAIPSIAAFGDFCIGESVTINILNPDSEIVYQWEGPNGFISEGETITWEEFPSDASGSYSVYAISEACNSDVLDFQVVPVVTQPAIFVEENALTTSVVADSYQWYLDNDPILGAVFNTFTPLESGFYSLEIVSNGCTVRSNDLLFAVLSSSSPITSLKIFPNPVQSVLNVEFGEAWERIGIFDLNGRLYNIEMYVLPDRTVQLNLDDLADGLYVIQITSLYGLYSELFLKN